MPLVPEDFGLEAGIRQLAERLPASTTTGLCFFSDQQERRFTPAFEVGAYRIAQDDGRGFNPAAAPPAGGGGYGLLNLKFRAEALGGKLEIDRRPGKGCVITIELPLSVIFPGEVSILNKPL